MAIHWTLKSVPELSNMPARERRIVRRRVYRRTWQHWQAWVGPLACGKWAGLSSQLNAEVDHQIVGAMIGGDEG